MHIHIVPNRGSTPTVLLRESYREGSKVGKRTLANLSSLSAAQIEAMRAALRGEALAPLAQAFEITASRSHGHVQAVALTMRRLGLWQDAAITVQGRGWQSSMSTLAPALAGSRLIRSPATVPVACPLKLPGWAALYLLRKPRLLSALASLSARLRADITAVETGTTKSNRASTSTG